MKLWLAALLRKLADWLAPKVVETVVEAVTDLLTERAKVLTAEQDAKWPDRSGEAKRHQVFSRLLKEFPDEAKRRIGLVIEQVLQ